METIQSEHVDSEILSALMRSLQDGVLVINGMNIIERANETASKILDVPLSDTLAGKHISTLRADGKIPDALWAALGGLQHGHPANDHATNKGSANEQLTNGHSTNGHSTNGHSTEGHSTNGHTTNGHTTNGDSINGHATNEHCASGHSTNGHSTNGTSLDKGDCQKNNFTISTFAPGQGGASMKVVILPGPHAPHKTCSSTAERTPPAQESHSELDEFAYIVSHDLKAPLRAINNLSLWLEEDLGSSLTGENRNNFVKLRSRVVRMEALINGILEYSLAGKSQVADEPIDVADLLKAAAEWLSPPPHITIQVSENLPIIKAPRVMLMQVFSNLLSNAIRYSDKAQGVIKVYGAEMERCYAFSVEDNGPGIPAEYHEKIFTVFQTLHARDKFESTGVGLTIVKRILAAKGGDIRMTSTLGKGSTFTFTWPKGPLI